MSGEWIYLTPDTLPSQALSEVPCLECELEIEIQGVWRRSRLIMKLHLQFVDMKKAVWKDHLYDFLHFFCVFWPRLCEHEEDDISRGVWCTAHRGGASVSLTLLLLLFWHAEDPLKLQKDPENVYCPPRAQAKTSVVPKTLRVVKRSGSCPWEYCTEPRLFLFHM